MYVGPRLNVREQCTFLVTVAYSHRGLEATELPGEPLTRKFITVRNDMRVVRLRSTAFAVYALAVLHQGVLQERCAYSIQRC